MRDGPKLHLKCVGHNTVNDWWVIGRLYPVVDGRITSELSPSGRSINTGPHLVESALEGRLCGIFVPVWVLPDGTELEALP